MSDEELIYLFTVVKNEWAFIYLYQRYQDIISIVTRKIFSRFYTIPLELSDLQSTTYFIFYQTIVNFQNDKQKTFKNFLLINLNWGLLKYLKIYLTKNHQILNLALNYQDYLIVDNCNQQNFFNHDDWKNLKLSFYEKNVLKLKYQGFSNREIMRKLNLSYKQVDNAFQRVISKFKKISQTIW